MAADDWQTIRSVRLRALSDAPSAFGSSYEQQSRESDEQWIERVQQLTDPQHAGTWLAWLHDEPAGMVVGVRDNKVIDRAWLVSMWVAPNVRRLGVGQQLIQSAIDWGSEQQIQALHLHVTDGNEPAKGLYQRVGFSMTGETMPHPRLEDLVEHEMKYVFAR